MSKIYLSLLLTTKRGIEELKPLFEITDENTELIVSDSNYNEKTKEWLSKQTGYEKIIYIPLINSPYTYQRDFVRGLNTAILNAENGWLIRADDNLEFKEDFFKTAREDIESFKDVSYNEKFAIVGQKLWGVLNHVKWNDYYSPSEPSRYINVTNPAFTFSFGLYPIDLIYNLNGYDERYDLGWGVEDSQFLHRSLVAGYKVFYDRYLMAYSHAHKPKQDSISTTQMMYHFEIPEINSGKIRAYNPYNFVQLHQNTLASRDKYIIKK